MRGRADLETKFHNYALGVSRVGPELLYSVRSLLVASVPPHHQVVRFWHSWGMIPLLAPQNRQHLLPGNPELTLSQSCNLPAHPPSSTGLQTLWLASE